MKILVQLGIAICCSLTFAQNVAVKDIKTEMSKGMQPGVQVFISGANEDQVKDAIKDATRKFKGDDEKIKKSDERFIDDARIEEISDNDIDIHYLIKEEDKGSTLQLHFNMGGVFLSDDLDARKYKYMRNFAERIALAATQLNYEELIDDEEKVLSGFVKDKKKSNSDIDKARKDIEKAKKEIAEKEQEIKKLESLVKEQTEKIAKQEEKVSGLKKAKAKAGK